MSFYRSKSKGPRFIGGKGKCGEIVRIVNDLMPPGRGVYWEPFCGSCKILQSVRASVRYAGDADPYIVTLLKAVRCGWEPPPVVTEKDYKEAKKQVKAGRVSPYLGFVGYCCSFGGRFMEGYARSKKTGTNFAASARRSLLRQKPFLQYVHFQTGDYREQVGPAAVPDVIYCDPPYEGTKPCGSVKTKFDSAEFWGWARAKAKRSVVLVSEYACPLPDAVVLWEKSVASGIRFGTGGDGGAKGDGRRKVEKLFCLDPELGRRVGLGIL